MMPQSSSPVYLNVFSVSESFAPTGYWVLAGTSPLMKFISDCDIGVATQPWRPPNDMATARAFNEPTDADDALQT